MLHVSKHLGSLIGIDEVLGEVHDAAHRMGLHALVGHIAGSRYLGPVFPQGLRRHHKQLGHLLLQGHGVHARAHHFGVVFRRGGVVAARALASSRLFLVERRRGRRLLARFVRAASQDERTAGKRRKPQKAAACQSVEQKTHRRPP